MSSQPNALAQTADFEFKALAEAGNYRAALLREFREHLRGHVLEVGCGIGQMTEELLKEPGIEELVSIEPDTGFCENLRSRLPGHQIVCGTVADLSFQRAWNAIVSINVLEHIEHDSKELAAYYQLLRPAHGALCLLVPAREEIYAPIDRDFGHFRRYTRAGLLAKLKEAGFRVHRLHYYNLVGYLLWFLNFRILRRRSFDATSVRLFDRVIFPVVHGFESHICRPPIGQSLIVTAFAA